MANKYKVAKSQWKKWNKIAGNSFNDYYEYFLENQWIFKHPESPCERQEYWDTTAWNMAWSLADAVQAATDG